MNIGRRVFFFVLMLLLAACLLYLVAGSILIQDFKVFTDGVGQVQWRSVGYGIGGDAVAAAWSRDGSLRLQPFTLDGKRGDSWNAVLPDEYCEGTITALCPVRKDLVMLGIYSLSGDSLAVFRLTKGAAAECLLQQSCPGEVSYERVSNTCLTRFYQENGTVYFGIYGDGELRSYSCSEEAGQVSALGSKKHETESILSAVVMSDGSWALGGYRGRGGYLDLDFSVGNVEGIGMARVLTRGRVGWYFLDAGSMEVRFVDPGTGTIQSLFSIASSVSDYTLTDLCLTGGEGALLLLDGNVLLHVTADGPELLTGILEPSLLSAAMTLAVFLLICIVVAALLTGVLCAGRRGYASMAVYYGSLLITLTLVSAIVINDAVLSPLTEEMAREANKSVIQGVIRAVLGEKGYSDSELINKICRELEYEEDGFRNVRVLGAAKGEDGEWLLADGARGAASPVFSTYLAEKVQQSGESEAVLIDESILYGEAGYGGVIMVRADDALEYDTASVGVGFTIAMCTLPVTLAAIVVFLVLVRRTRRMTRQMELITEGQATGENRLVMRTGDEFESMASSINSLAEWLEQTDRNQKELVESYRRFVPEKVLALLGKSSILKVSKDTFSVRRMTVMRVGFEYPRKFYTDPENSRALFESINKVIERTASIASQKGGTVYNFAPDRYDVVMELDSAQAVSCAVAIQQQTLSFNESRAAEGLPQVELSIAIDVGDVILGLVGDDTRLEPAGISTCFSVVQELLTLCRRLDAKILCTELIASGAEQYGNRYVGKCTVGQAPVRVYEIFEGDEYLLRRAKAGQAGEFSKAVLYLYSGETATAKREFLRLAHRVPEDGTARYYLYLSDRMERDPRLECSLNAPVENQEGR